MKLKLADIIDLNGKILDYENLTKKISLKVKVLDYYGLIKATEKMANNPLIKTINRGGSIS